MFDRPIGLYYASEWIRETVILLPGETAKVRFKAWFAEKMPEPRCCRCHPNTQLVLDPGGISKAYKNDTGFPPWGGKEETEPNVFEFSAVLRCPACWCAYAHCPPEFHELSFDTFDADTPERVAVLARAREFAAQVNEHDCGFALFVGGPGAGKTRLACNVVRALAHRDALYVRQGELTLALRSTYGRKHDPESDDPAPLEIVQKVYFLVLDEIGCNSLANDELLLLDELLKYRFDNRKPTILISNLPLDKLQAFLGDAPYDRIRYASGGGRFILQFKGESYRRGDGENYLRGLG